VFALVDVDGKGYAQETLKLVKNLNTSLGLIWWGAGRSQCWNQGCGQVCVAPPHMESAQLTYGMQEGEGGR
jgi:hypothetical protein